MQILNGKIWSEVISKLNELNRQGEKFAEGKKYKFKRMSFFKTENLIKVTNVNSHFINDVNTIINNAIKSIKEKQKAGRIEPF